MRAVYCTLDEAVAIANAHNRRGDDIALCTGCFDILHVGHLKIFEEAAIRGSVFVGINTDEPIRVMKGRSRPVNKLDHRVAMLTALRAVDFVFPIASLTVSAAILSIKPKWWLKGASYTMETLDYVEREAAKIVGAEIILVPIVEGVSTTKILASGVTLK